MYVQRANEQIVYVRENQTDLTKAVKREIVS
jgi:hypothetical protein